MVLGAKTLDTKRICEQSYLNLRSSNTHKQEVIARRIDLYHRTRPQVRTV